MIDRYFINHNKKTVIAIDVRAIFGGGWIDFARKIWGSARKMNSRTSMIKQDDTRKLDYIDCGKSLKNLYLHSHLSFCQNIAVKPRQLLTPDFRNSVSYELELTRSSAIAEEPREASCQLKN